MSQTNTTLSEAELLACQPVVGEGGRVLRAFCPFHHSDHQRSLRVIVATGRFLCFACEAWHIPSDFVVNQWPYRMRASHPLIFCRDAAHGGATSHKTTSTISAG
jgi:hypothetical protein